MEPSDDSQKQKKAVISLANDSQPIELRPGEAIRLPDIEAQHRLIGLRIISGIGRLSAECQHLRPDVTLAFCGRADQEWISTYQVGTLQLEALTPLELHLNIGSRLVSGSDLISEWLVMMHLVRHHLMAEKRFHSLLKLLITQFGVRVPRGYRLPFSLGHSRVAELIGVTRSTATRQFTLLRRESLLFTDRDGTLLAMPELIEGNDFGSLFDA